LRLGKVNSVRSPVEASKKKTEDYDVVVDRRHKWYSLDEIIE
jgi:hypothetical protein